MTLVSSVHSNMTASTSENPKSNDNNNEETRANKDQDVLTMSSSNPVSLSDPLEALDPNIMADKESSMLVTGWVRANYVEEREHNVPRKDMFEHYKSYCIANKLQPVNSATFGKLLRVVFPALKTRRLGVRGQSKYHYCGIRVKNTYDASSLTGTSENQGLRSPASVRANTSISMTPSSSSSSPYHVNTSTQEPTTIPTFVVPLIPHYRHNHEIDQNLVSSFTSAYERHCREIFQLISTGQVQKVRNTMQDFYQDMPGNFMRMIHSVPEITESIWRWDCSLYDAVINKFLPTVNHPLAQTMATVLRTYTRELREYIENALIKFPTSLTQKKLDVARIFSAKCRRQLSLNYAAQTASTALSRHELISVMRQDWEHFDVDGILDQTLWVCDCDINEVKNILRIEVHDLLNNKPTIEHWMEWVSTVVGRYLKRYMPSNLNEATQYLIRSKQLLLKWNYYTTLIMKEFTLQQAQSFISFHNLRLFLDDYILYLVEENIAQVNFMLTHHQQQQQQQQQQQRHKSDEESFINYYTTPPSSGIAIGSDLTHKDHGSKQGL
ncbi:RFX DNA-binding domain-containing protein [Gilbertella persicaria]|uniref:RFX DNA-binding domain-containing protein n=1 Tax=Gilbertella persicaria TaxID=101096 RepID=UPI00221FAC7E|nr:RFX DNA-binding domain-containing protein [Gilbertella persicaria]KAI8090928.1 RFX DNA-binding domain-containing protein [Gilbertella persicaria]